jgi:RecA/RadA recombinase
MTPQREVEESAEKGQRPDQAILTNRLMRTIQSSMNSLGLDNPNKPAVVQVNQFRQKVGIMWGDPTTWPGGLGQNFAASILISMRAGKKIDGNNRVVDGTNKKKDAASMLRAGQVIHYAVEKNKTFPPYKKGEFRLYNLDLPDFSIRTGDVNNLEQMVEHGVHAGLIDKSGAWLDLTEMGITSTSSKSGKFQGLQELVDYLRQNPNDAEKVSAVILAHARNTAYKSGPQDEDDDD